MSTASTNRPPLTKQQKIERLALIEEKKKRLLASKPRYKANEGQLLVHNSSTKDRYVFSGNGSGKTTLLVNEVMAAARGVNPWTGEKTKVPAKILIILDNTRKVEERFIPEFRKWFEMEDKWLKRLGKPHTSRIELDNGSVIDFYSSDADPSSFEGIESSMVCIDEPLPRTLWVALKRSLRLRGHPCRLLFCGTAVDQAWLRKDIYEPWAKGELPEVECFRVSSHVNAANLDESYLENFSGALSDAERSVRIDGGFFDTDSQALAHLWDRSIHLVPPASFKYDSRMPCVVAVDCHSVKPHTAVMICATEEGRLLVLKELRLRATATEFAIKLKEWMNGYRVIDVVCDSLGSMEGTAFEGFTSFIDAVNQTGLFRMRPTRFEEKSHEDLIDRLRNGLGIPVNPDNFGKRIPTLRVLSDCKGVISDVENAGWQKNRASGEVRAKLDTSALDFLSCLGYCLAVNLFYSKSAHSRPVQRVHRPLYNVTKPPKEAQPLGFKFNRKKP